MQPTAVVIVVAGLLLGAWSTWQHLGRTSASRRWARSVQGELKERSVLVVRPLGAVFLVGGGVAAGFPGTPVGVVSGVLALVCVLVLTAYLVLPLPIPSFARPAWHRGAPARRTAS